MIGQRIKEIRKELKFNQIEFAEKLGINQSTLSHYESSRNLPSVEALNIISNLGINLDWLITGRGAMFYNEDEKPQNGDLISIPILGVKASAGYGKETFDIEPIGYFKLTKKAFPNVTPDRIRNIQVIGDSMTPTLEDGDWITMVEGMIAGNGIYVLNNLGELFIKRVNFKFNNEIEIISDNPKYGTEKLTREETIIVGKCVTRLGKLL